MNWPLNVNNFSFLDRLKISLFILNEKNRWTQDKRVKEFEEKMASFAGSKYAVFCSSGSTANTMLAMMLKDEKNKKKTIIFPSTTWTTSIAPFLREGFTAKFVDVNLKDFCFNYEKLEKALQDNDDTLCIFATSLLGFVPDISKLIKLSKKYSVKLMMDNCENTFGKFNNKNVSSFATSTTSTYFGHQLQSIEGGFVFTNSKDEYDYLLMARNHGMTRSVDNPEKYQNKQVDSRFDFYTLGNNFRNTDLNAFIGLIDFSKIDSYIVKRKQIFEFFCEKLDINKYILPFKFPDREISAFSLPILFKDSKNKNAALEYCNKEGIETRPIISGNLLRQTCYKNFGNYEDFPNSEFLHQNGFYVGLHAKLKISRVEKLVKYLNSL
jgi:CDP-6-deoxy-D-xylo-4-hexulose-3-dehydrase